jgi:hypothetical protein
MYENRNILIVVVFLPNEVTNHFVKKGGGCIYDCKGGIFK